MTPEEVIAVAYAQWEGIRQTYGGSEIPLDEFRMRAVAHAQAGDASGLNLMGDLMARAGMKCGACGAAISWGNGAFICANGHLGVAPAARAPAPPVAPATAHPFAYAQPTPAPRRRMTVAEVRAAGGYAAVYADPPWQYDDQNCNGAAEQQYSSLSLEQLKMLPVSHIAAVDAALFMWATYPKIQDALDLIPHWGFTYKSYAFDWVKLRGGQPQMGLGRWFRGASEVCLLAVRGRPERLDAGVRQLIETMDEGEGRILRAEAGRHSAKPREARERIERLLGDVPRIELFARERAPGWDAWGDEVESDIQF